MKIFNFLSSMCLCENNRCHYNCCLHTCKVNIIILYSALMRFAYLLTLNIYFSFQGCICIMQLIFNLFEKFANFFFLLWRCVTIVINYYFLYWVQITDRIRSLPGWNLNEHTTFVSMSMSMPLLTTQVVVA